jgi:hypothetical protein
LNEPEVVPKGKREKQRSKKEDEIGLDYEDDFADDEEINIGIEDEEEAKEAIRRMHEKPIAGEGESEDENELRNNSTARVIFFL